jgi:hypothetical protein
MSSQLELVDGLQLRQREELKLLFRGNHHLVRACARSVLEVQRNIVLKIESIYTD